MMEWIYAHAVILGITIPAFFGALGVFGWVITFLTRSSGGVNQKAKTKGKNSPISLHNGETHITINNKPDSD